MPSQMVFFFAKTKIKYNTRDRHALVSEMLSNKNLSAKMSNKKISTAVTSKEVIFSHTDAANDGSALFRFSSIFGVLAGREAVTSEP